MAQKHSEAMIEETEKKLSNLDMKVDGISAVLTKVANSVKRLVVESNDYKRNRSSRY